MHKLLESNSDISKINNGRAYFSVIMWIYEVIRSYRSCKDGVRRMDLHHLEYIIEIANMHNISRAADNLHITQSTLSQYLSKLEGELGIRLFDRRRNEVVLTTAGELYVEACRQILMEKRELYGKLQDLAETRTGSFSVGITPQWGSVAFSHIFVPFHKLYPNIQIKVKEETATPLLQFLSDRQIDMAIIPLENNVSLPQKSMLLHAEELVLAIPKEKALKLPLIQMGNTLPGLDIAAMEKEPMIFSQTKTTIRKLEDQLFASKNITPNIVAEINSHPASLVMVEKGLGSTFIPVSCAAPSKQIVYAHSIPLVQWMVVVAFRKGFTLRQGEKYFLKLTKEYFDSIHHGQMTLTT